MLCAITVSLGWIDLTVLIAALVSAIAVGVWFSRRNRSAQAFLYADHAMPWWAVLGSIVATETSAVTVLSVTGLGFGGVGMKFLQFAVGLLLGRLVVAYWLMPLFFSGKITSAYQVLDQRFGPVVRRFAGAMFLVARNLGDGLRLYLGALVLQVLLGRSLAECVLITGGVTIVYTCLGGLRSVVWNDCIQLLIYMAGGIATLFFLANHLPGGWGALLSPADAGKLNPIDAGFDWANPYQLWAGVLGGAVLGMGTHGTDQMMVQRYLSTRSQRQASLALSISGLVVVFQFALFLFIGVGLGVFYANRDDAPEKTDQVYQHFIVNHFPHNSGLAGLMLAAVLAATMSTLSSSFSASASSLLNDFVRPMLRKPLSERGLLRLSQAMAVGFGLVQVVIGIVAQYWGGTVVGNALSIAGFVFGILLGLFALGLWVPRASSSAAMIGALTSLALLCVIQFVLPMWEIKVAFPWLAVVGSGTALLVGWLVSLVFPRQVNAI